MEEDSAEMERAKGFLLKAALRRREKKASVIDEEEGSCTSPIHILSAFVLPLGGLG